MSNIINFIKSIFIGVAIIVPGLSGSMFAVAVGLYDKILYYVNSFRKDFKKSIQFLLPVIIGVGVGVLVSVKLVLYISEKYGFQSYSFFIGLVLGGIPIVYKKIKGHKITLPNIAVAVICFSVVSVLSGSLEEETAGSTHYIMESINSLPDFLSILSSGFISCFLMAFPGVSGSVVLMLLNRYFTVYSAVSALSDSIFLVIKGTQPLSAVMEPLFIVFTFLIGAALGLILAARFIEYILKRYETASYCGIFGLILGAVVTLFRQGVAKDLFARFSNGDVILPVITVVVFICIGFLSSLFFDGKESKS